MCDHHMGKLPPNRQIGTTKKHYLPATSLAGGNKMHISDTSYSIEFRDRQGEMTTQRERSDRKIKCNPM